MFGHSWHIWICWPKKECWEKNRHYSHRKRIHLCHQHLSVLRKTAVIVGSRNDYWMASLSDSTTLQSSFWQQPNHKKTYAFHQHDMRLHLFDDQLLQELLVRLTRIGWAAKWEDQLSRILRQKTLLSDRPALFTAFQTFMQHLWTPRCNAWISRLGRSKRSTWVTWESGGQILQDSIVLQLDPWKRIKDDQALVRWQSFPHVNYILSSFCLSCSSLLLVIDWSQSLWENLVRWQT
jgi:hypothetical protein